MAEQPHTIEALFEENRTFPPSADFTSSAIVSSPTVYDEAGADPEGFWERQAERLVWRRRWDQVLDWSGAPFAKWFVGGRLNVTESCLDRHLGDHPDRAAYYWEGEPGDRKVLTYAQLHAEVCRLANALAELGVEKGDRVAIYMGMVPELPAAMLACARLGAAHSVVFGGFSAESLADRINDAQAKVLVTCDGSWRAGSVVPLKAMADDALAHTPSITSVLVVRRTGNDVTMVDGRDHWYHDRVDHQHADRPAVECDSEDLLYLLYTSGTTAKPKGIVHTTGGYAVHTYLTSKLIFDLKDDDVYWCTADIGWVTGHSYVVYGILQNGVTTVMYEGAPNYPENDRFWKIIEDHRVTVFYTAPTAIRAFIKWGDEFPNRHKLDSLRLLGSVGEPINPQTWMWYSAVIGKSRCPIVDTWWQTETGGIMISPLPGITATKPGAAMRPLPGISAKVIDNDGNEVGNGEGGYLVLTEPWPGMLRGIWGDPERYQETYWSRFPGYYFAGDGAKLDDDGDLWLLGRVDDVMNVSGHRISTAEIEHALVSHPRVAEAAVVGASDATTGQAVVAFVTVKGQVEGDEGESLVRELRDHVATVISPIAKPRQILLTPDLPKTRSGKIMRRLLRDVAEHRDLGDVTTLVDSSVVSMIDEQMRTNPAAGDEE